jgi:ABC-type sugar transport system permease subunit
MKSTLGSYGNRRKMAGFLFVLPVVLYFGLLYYLPLVTSFHYSFLEVLPKQQTRFAGLQTYRWVLADPLFWTSVRNTVIFTAISAAAIVLLGLLISIVIHNLFSQGLRDVYTVFYVLPTLVSFAAAGPIWEWIFHSQFGLANLVLSVFGIPSLKFLNDSVQVIPSLAVINLWVRSGFAVLIFSAGLKSIPDSYFEAARVDGAVGLKLHVFITIPLLLPQIGVISLLEVIFGFKVFDVVYVTTSGGPATASYMILFYFYDNAFRFYRQDRASVIAVLMFLALLVFSILQRRIVRGRRYEI